MASEGGCGWCPGCPDGWGFRGAVCGPGGRWKGGGAVTFIIPAKPSQDAAHAFQAASARICRSIQSGHTPERSAVIAADIAEAMAQLAILALAYPLPKEEAPPPARARALKVVG